MDARERIRERLFGNSNNFKKSRWKPVRDFINTYYDDIDEFIKQGGKLSSLAEVIQEETGIAVPLEVLSTLKSRIKKAGKRPSVSQPPAPQKAPNEDKQEKPKKPWSNLELRTSKDFVDVDIRDL